MPFPVVVGETTISTARELGYWVVKDAMVPGTLVKGEDPRQWFVALSDTLTEDELCGVLRALLDRPNPVCVGLGGWLVGALKPDRMGPWLLRAIRMGDLGALMSRDPYTDTTVEGALARVAASWLPLEEDSDREAVLQALRNAGALVEEAGLLARSGSEAEIALFGPGLLATGNAEVREALETGVARDPEGELLKQLLGGAP